MFHILLSEEVAVESGNVRPFIQTYADKIVYGIPIHIYGIFKYVAVIFDFNTIRRIDLHVANLLS
jgi:hypothetical protein